MLDVDHRKEQAAAWFRELRDRICAEFERMEDEAEGYAGSSGRFERKTWDRPEGGGLHGGGGEMSILKGRLFEKVGVNISIVHGRFSEAMAKEIPGAAEDPRFWAAGISLVSHMASPLVPAVHMNTRFLVVGDGRVAAQKVEPEAGPGGSARKAHSKQWFGGGADLTPMLPDDEAAERFHAALKQCCDRHDPSYYPDYKAWCDSYFHLQHRNEPRGAGGIFYDYLATGNWEDDFAFTREVGETFARIYPEIVRSRMDLSWSDADREAQLVKRGRYVEFNLLYDRGTRFGLMTGGNTEAILMSLPPVAKWP